MIISRRSLLRSAAFGASMVALSSIVRAAEPDLSALQSLTTGARPIGKAERLARVAKAQGLMRKAGIGAVLIEAGSSLDYFTGVRWGRSERLTAVVLPVEGEAMIVTPFFERPSVEQTLAIPADVRVWQEDEDPLKLVAGFLTERKLSAQPIGIEETVRFFAFDGLKRVLPDARIVSANPIVRGCRMIKTPAEIALMEAASNVTVAAYRWLHPRIEKGMTQPQISALMNAATRKLGGTPEFAMALVGEGAAYPHGSIKPQVVADGQIVLMDCGCTVEGYQSDISRTWVFGQASKEQRTLWDHVAEGQRIAFATAKLGVPAGSVDDAVRAAYEKWGYGPRYQLPGLSHRTGHGIGMDGHEPVNLVHGEATPLGVGMCFSNEPGLYIPGAFGVRLEDCFHMTESGPCYFSQPPKSIDEPV
ncbi:aminopeptidase P family protein [Sphingomonas crocodyli]|uniref:Aminopeptidase P family protein n=2 Tax=Sphingomonas crocodyli TaxID=1979270 RepID=A0A437LUN3_9SPHN|nr:Xaa-Pro peptidase family protein [Sphingomonas crocodyli]RVT89089.1 aminopeptidase P family protein [Sphingomonas crocodyli]